MSLRKLIVDIIANTSELKPGLDKGRQEVSAFKRFVDGAMGRAKQMTSVFAEIRRPLENMAGNTLGLSNNVENLIFDLGGLAVGGGTIAAVAGGLTLVGTLMSATSAETRKAAKETDEWIAKMEKAAKLRANPNFELDEGVKGAEKRIADLRQKIQDLQAENGKVVLSPGREGSTQIVRTTIDNTLRIAEAQKDLASAERALGEARQQEAKKGDDLITSLARELAVLQLNEGAVKRLEIANDQGLTPAQRQGALAIYDKIQALKQQKEAHDKAAKAAKDHADQMQRVRDAARRAEMESGKELADFTDGQRERMKKERSDWVDAQDKFRKSTKANAAAAGKELMEWYAENNPTLKAAKEWQKAWEDAISASSQAFANFFVTAFTEGQKLRDFLKGLLAQIAGAFATFGAQRLTKTIVRGVFPSAAPSGGGGGDEIALRTGVGTSSGSPVVVHQNLQFNVGFVDGATGEQWLRSQSSTVAGIVARAAREAPGYAHAIVANGLRA